MTTARSQQINIESTPYYHVMARCVRRSYLCGIDKQTNRDYSHRKKWIITRLKFLAQIFSINICAYAVMSNHYHVVLFVNEKVAKKWTDDEVIARWASIFPKDAKRHSHILSKISLWRERLTSISWFMRCINETIARASNDEDDCAGRFWEGRFKCQALLDEGALLSAMAYVDLNPIRAGIAQTPEQSESTSIYERIQCMGRKIKFNKLTDNKHKQPKKLVPFSIVSLDSLNSDEQEPKIDFDLLDYLDLVDYSGRVFREDKTGIIPEKLPAILTRLNFDRTGWLSMVKNLHHKFYYAIGNEMCLVDFSKNRNRNRKRIAKGLSAAKELYLA